MNLLLDVGHSRLKLGRDGPGGVALVGRFEAGDREALRAALERLRPAAVALHMADGGADPGCARALAGDDLGRAGDPC